MLFFPALPPPSTSLDSVWQAGRLACLASLLFSFLSLLRLNRNHLKFDSPSAPRVWSGTVSASLSSCLFPLFFCALAFLLKHFTLFRPAPFSSARRLPFLKSRKPKPSVQAPTVGCSPVLPCLADLAWSRVYLSTAVQQRLVTSVIESLLKLWRQHHLSPSASGSGLCLPAHCSSLVVCAGRRFPLSQASLPG